MLTAIVSDLHLGTSSGADVARLPEVRERLAEELAQADRVVLLGDLLELRELPAREVLVRARATLEAIGRATAGRQVVLVPGNHDHALVAPALARSRLGGRALGVAEDLGFDERELAGRVAALMPETDVRVAYPGVWIREDVFATHGHYLDLHLTIPRLECLALSLLGRVGGRDPDDGATVAAYEDAVAPLYAFAQAVAERSASKSVTQGGRLSRRVWRTANRDRDGLALAHALVARIALPTAVGLVNALGLGPYRADISGLELRRSGLRALAHVIDALGVDADHVIFGHTHRAGPLPTDAEGWWLPGGTQLTNTGSWLLEAIFTADGDPAGPYWPGRVTLVGDSGPPELVRVLDGLGLEAPSPSAAP